MMKNNGRFCINTPILQRTVLYMCASTEKQAMHGPSLIAQ